MAHLSGAHFRRMIKRQIATLSKIQKYYEDSVTSDEDLTYSCASLGIMLGEWIVEFHSSTNPYLEWSSTGTNLTDEQIDDEIQKIHDNYSQLKFKIGKMQERIRVQHSVAGSTGAPSPSSAEHLIQFLPTSTPSSLAALPPLTLPKFNGDTAEWQKFKQCFNALVGNQTNISIINKFQYLLGCLDERSASLVNHLGLTDDNYKLAFELLDDRFDHPIRRAMTLAARILHVPELSLSNFRRLESSVDSLNGSIKSLNTLKTPTTDNVLAVSLLFSKMDHHLLDKFQEKTKGSSEFPTVNSILEFLQATIKHRDGVFQLSKELKQPHSSSSSSGYAKSHQKITLLTNKSEESNVYKTCPICSTGVHCAAACPVFKEQTVPARSNLVSKYKICRICLEHDASISCNSQVVCTVCGLKHHTLLHFGSKWQSNVQPNSPKSNYNNNSFPPCLFCQLPKHSLSICQKFISLPVHERARRVSELNLCARCLRGHSDMCYSKLLCNHCNGEHHTLLHKENDKQSNFKNTTQPTDTLPTLVTSANDSVILMATCYIKVAQYQHDFLEVRALIDTASSASVISERCAALLKVNRNVSKCRLAGLGNTRTRIKGQCTLNVFNMNEELVLEQHPFIIVNKITNATPAKAISGELVARVAHLPLGDSHFNIPTRVDIILSAHVAARTLFKGKSLQLGDDLPHVVETPFGHIVIGEVPSRYIVPGGCVYGQPSCPIFTTCIINAKQLDSRLETFWTLNEPPSSVLQYKTRQDLECEQQFQDTVQRLPNGRYQVRLPFEDNGPNKLGSSYNHALKRFKNLEGKFNKSPVFKDKYVEFINDCIDQGHLVPYQGPISYVIPHQGIFKKHGNTDKIRVVFDASAPTTTGISLNDVLYSGPKLQPDIVDIVTKFRIFKCAFTCDIRQMFRQVMLHPSDYAYHVILWRDHPSKDLQCYCLTCVTYGTRSAPYLANKTLKQLAYDDGHLYPKAKVALEEHIYVDDIVTGADTIGEAIELRDEIIQLAKRGGFELRKWESNCPSLVQTLPASILDASEPSTKEMVSLLGISWSAKSDNFTVVSPEVNKIEKVTKRVVASVIPQIYDPCGWWAPVVVRAKIMLQKLWSSKIGWDEEIPVDLIPEWLLFLESAEKLCKHELPRHLGVPVGEKVELHCFVDASSAAYAAVVYLLYSGEVLSSSLLISKTKVAPLKTITIPRLELCAAVLGAQLLEHMFHLLSTFFSIQGVFGWSDSTIVLSWIQTEPVLLKTFVANRVAAIQSIQTPIIWKHVTSECNPADVASRGCTSEELIQHQLWWSAPKWLHDQALWPIQSKFNLSADAQSELKHEAEVGVCCVVNNEVSEPEIFRNISTWNRLVEVVRLILHWKRQHCNLSPPRYDDILTAIIFYIQHTKLKGIIDLLEHKRHNELPVKIQKLKPFLNDKKIICVSGRLQHAQSVRNKTPFLLPKNDRLVKLLINHYHIFFDHLGTTSLLYQLSLNFWLINARQQINNVLHNCTICFRAKPTPVQQLMGQLPEPRVNECAPFAKVGVDFAGPFLIKTSHLKRSPTVKVWVCLFICMSTKAVHIELAADLSSGSFLDVLKRFVSRRGLPSDIYCDCGTNFVGLSNKIKLLWKQLWEATQGSAEFTHYCLMQNINFHHNPPSCPSMGGLWERAIRSLKYHLVRVLRNNLPTWEALNSILIVIEGILNSRPLTPMSSDPGDLEALTPSHFLIGRPLQSVIEDKPCIKWVTPIHLRWRQQVAKYIWDRWRREYLITLYPRSKWFKENYSIQLNDLVLVDEPNLPPMSWLLGRVVSMSPGADGLVRVVTIKTKGGTLVRPLVKLHKLPIKDPDEQIVDAVPEPAQRHRPNILRRRV